MKRNINSSKYIKLAALALLILTACGPTLPPPQIATSSRPSTTIELSPASPTSASIGSSIPPTKTPGPIITPQMSVIKPSTHESQPLLTIAYMDGQFLVLECLENDKYNQRFDLSAITTLEHPFTLESVYYLYPSDFLVWMSSDKDNRSVFITLNRETGQKKATYLPSKTMDGIMAHGRLVLRDYENSTIYIIQHDLQIRTIDLGSDIFQLAEASDNNVMAINHQPVDQDGKTYIEVFMIDIHTGKFQREMVRSPAFTDPLFSPEFRSSNSSFAGWLITVSTDLEFVYLLYNSRIGDDSFKQAIGVFDTNTLDEVKTFKDPNFITFRNMTLISSRQYKNTSYPATAYSNPEGISQGLNAPFNLSTLTPIIDTLEIIKKEFIKTLHFVPFGDYLAIGTNSRVILVTLDGEDITEFPLLQNRTSSTKGIFDYKIIEYHP